MRGLEYKLVNVSVGDAGCVVVDGKMCLGTSRLAVASILIIFVSSGGGRRAGRAITVRPGKNRMVRCPCMEMLTKVTPMSSDMSSSRRCLDHGRLSVRCSPVSASTPRRLERVEPVSILSSLLTFHTGSLGHNHIISSSCSDSFLLLPLTSHLLLNHVQNRRPVSHLLRPFPCLPNRPQIKQPAPSLAPLSLSSMPLSGIPNIARPACTSLRLRNPS